MNMPYDYVIDVDGRLYKIQVKTTEKIKDGKRMLFHTCRTNPNTKRRIFYQPNEIDYFFLYCIENDWCGIIDVHDTPKDCLSLYLKPVSSYNSQNVRYADSYEFDYKINELINQEILPNRYPKQIEVGKEEIKNHDRKKNIETEITGRTTREKLKNEIRNMPMTHVSAIYGVTDNAIRKWCIRMGLPNKKQIIDAYTDLEWETI